MITVEVINDQQVCDNTGSNFDRSIILPELNDVTRVLFIPSLLPELSQTTMPKIVVVD